VIQNGRVQTDSSIFIREIYSHSYENYYIKGVLDYDSFVHSDADRGGNRGIDLTVHKN
jgi:hypothetical protein